MRIFRTVMASRSLGVMFLFLSGLAHAGGSEIGNGRTLPDRLTRVPMPMPTAPKAGQAGMPFKMVALELSDVEIREGETIRATAVVELPQGMEDAKAQSCTADLASDELLHTRLRFDDCSVERIDPLHLRLKLANRFPGPTVSRSYFVDLAQVTFAGGPTISSWSRQRKSFRVIGTASSLKDADPVNRVSPSDSWIETPLACSRVPLGAPFALVARIPSRYEVTNSSLSLALDQGRGFEDGTLPAQPGQPADDWISAVSVTWRGPNQYLRIELRVPADWELLSKIAIPRVTVVTEALEELELNLGDLILRIGTAGTPETGSSCGD